MLFPPICKNYEIPTNVTDKNTKFTTKSVHIVTCGSFKIFISNIYIYIYIYIYGILMFMVWTHFVQCIKIVQSLQYSKILFHVNESNAEFNA